MTAIRVRCRSCGREVDSAECDRQLHCAGCVALAECSADLSEYERLWRKRARYGRAGVALASVEAQLGRVVKRVSKRLHDRLRSGEDATTMLNEALEQARQRATSARILVPQR